MVAAKAGSLPWDTNSLTPIPQWPLPGRPHLPELIVALVPTRSPTTEGRAALHAICHIEFNAINLALDAVGALLACPGVLPRLVARAAEEAEHFSLLHNHLRTPAQQPKPALSIR